jgi:hypothetical protein
MAKQWRAWHAIFYFYKIINFIIYRILIYVWMTMKLLFMYVENLP